ncbi:MAG: hypothetical protein H6849_04415 [Alphaproteobacteria bacterium]|nr:MAG: hypothetical protein H6849_04415 [Alphaproteobacteria bacterium]
MLKSSEIRGLEKKIVALEEKRQALLLARARELAKIIDACEIEHMDFSILAGSFAYIKSLIRVRDVKVALWRSNGEELLRAVETPAPIRKLNALEISEQKKQKAAKRKASLIKKGESKPKMTAKKAGKMDPAVPAKKKKESSPVIKTRKKTEESNVFPIQISSPEISEEERERIPLIDDTLTTHSSLSENPKKPLFKGEVSRKSVFDDVNFESIIKYWS